MFDVVIASESSNDTKFDKTNTMFCFVLHPALTIRIDAVPSRSHSGCTIRGVFLYGPYRIDGFHRLRRSRRRRRSGRSGRKRWNGRLRYVDNQRLIHQLGHGKLIEFDRWYHNELFERRGCPGLHEQLLLQWWCVHRWMQFELPNGLRRSRLHLQL